jgi:holliday junction DNA helicase RuvA
MIGYISGIIRHLEDGKITITPEGMGIGYEILIPSSVLGLDLIGSNLTLFVYHHKTDVSETLFGFPDIATRTLFKKLLKVDGVGWKTALSLLNIGIRELLIAIENGDEKVISSANGVGKKTALKIIVELKKELTGESLFPKEENSTPQVMKPKKGDTQWEMETALLQMGYEKKAVQETIARIPDEITTLETQVIWAIRELAQYNRSK